MFTIAIAEEKVKPFQTVALHFLVGLALFTFGVLSYLFYFYTINITNAASSMPELKRWGPVMLFPGLAILIISLFRGRWLKKPKNNKALRIIEIGCSILYAGYFAYGHWWLPAGIFGILAATLLLATLWESNKNRAQFINIDEKGVQLPSTSRRGSLAWNEIEQVILRFGILTIDCVDNHLYQWNVNAAEFSKEELEAYCSKLVIANKGKNKGADW